MANEKKFLIQSMEHTLPDQLVMWWRPMSMGYTRMIEEAGRYTEAAAADICSKAGPDNERMWTEEDVLAGKAGEVRTVVLLPSIVRRAHG